MNQEDVISLFDAFNNLKILVIGDVMVDVYLWGTVERISPEAPVPVVTCTKRESRLGGAANVALNLISMGAYPVLCSVIGDDYNGQVFLDMLKNNKLDDSGIYKHKSRPTTVKTRIISSHQHMLRIDEETDKHIEPSLEHDFLNHISQMMSHHHFDAIIFQDYDKGTITLKIIEQVIEAANKNRIPVLVDPKKRFFSQYKHISLFKPNFKEFSEGLKTDLNKEDIARIYEAAQTFQRDNGIDLLMVTLSEKGIFISDSSRYFIIPAHVRAISDVSGAGDTVISIASLCVACKLKTYEIAMIANTAGGLVCEKVGVVPIQKEELKKECLLLFA